MNTFFVAAQLKVLYARNCAWCISSTLHFMGSRHARHAMLHIHVGQRRSQGVGLQGAQPPWTSEVLPFTAAEKIVHLLCIYFSSPIETKLQQKKTANLIFFGGSSLFSFADLKRVIALSSRGGASPPCPPLYALAAESGARPSLE